MHVYKRVRLFAHAHLSVYMCKDQIWAETTFDFPTYLRLFQLSFITRKYVQNIS